MTMRQSWTGSTLRLYVTPALLARSIRSVFSLILHLFILSQALTNNIIILVLTFFPCFVKTIMTNALEAKSTHVCSLMLVYHFQVIYNK